MATAPTTHVEVERKLTADPGLVLPDLDGLPGVAAVGPAVEHDLEATYFDTADLRLSRAGISLRRRTGGTDDGWHLKVPSSDDARVELRRPLGRAVRTPPAALVEQVRVVVRDQVLAPVATIRTHRTVRLLEDGQGNPLVEVADDRVRAESAHGEPVEWREVEVELAGGDRDLLAAAVERLTAAGARPSGSGSKVRRVLGVDRPAEVVGDAALGSGATAGDVLRAHLAEQVGALMRYDPLARVDAPDAVHKMRVATRRLRSALATFRRLVDRSVTDPVREELKWLGGVLGGPRDEEVMHARLVELIAEQPKELVLGPVRRRVDADLRSRHKAAHRALVDELDGERYFRLLDALDRLVADPPLTEAADKPAHKVLPKLVARTRQRVLGAAEEAEQASGDAHEEALHEVRKAAKRARYAAEAVEPVFGTDAGELARSMEHLQEVLGEHQDSTVTRETLRRLGVTAHFAGENGFTFGRLHGLEVGRAERARAQYADALAAVAGKPPKWLR